MDATRIKRVRFRAWRRGFVEADLILGPFADAHVQILDDDEMERFERLLDEDDHDLWDWISGAAPTPPALDDAVMARLRVFVRNGRGRPG